jgi:hypothetical protein
MKNEEDLNYCISRLEEDDSQSISRILKVLVKGNTADERLVPYIENKLTDTRPCLLYLKPTFTYGEVRWLAASVLFNYYKLLGIDKKIDLIKYVIPLTFGDMRLIEEENNLSIKLSGEDPRERACQLFLELQRLNLLPTEDLNQ